jgi:hypothetical protein
MLTLIAKLSILKATIAPKVSILVQPESSWLCHAIVNVRWLLKLWWVLELWLSAELLRIDFISLGLI